MSLLVNQLGEALAAMKERAERAEAQVQAVRDVCKTYHLDDSYPNRRKVIFLDRILRALDRDVIGVRQDETNNNKE